VQCPPQGGSADAESNLALPDEIATHLSGACNDSDITGLYLFYHWIWDIIEINNEVFLITVLTKPVMKTI